MVGWVLFVVGLVFLCFGRVLPACKKKGSTGLAFQQLVPVILMNFLVSAFEFEIREKLCKWVMLVVGLHNFYLTAQVIVFSMAHQEFPMMQKSVLLFAGLTAASYVVPLRFFTPVIACYTLAFGGFVLLWVYSAGDQISSRLNIKIF